MPTPVAVAGSVEQKMEQVFGPGGSYYTDQATAESHMVKVQVADQNLTMPTPVAVAGSVEQKMEQVFGPGGSYYTDQATAESHMVKVQVQVWSLMSSGQKTPPGHPHHRGQRGHR